MNKNTLNIVDIIDIGGARIFTTGFLVF